LEKTLFFGKFHLNISSLDLQAYILLFQDFFKGFQKI
jgi:hypothetical protein